MITEDLGPAEGLPDTHIDGGKVMIEGRSLGFIFGIVLGVILVIVIFKLANTNKKVVTEYDERQKAIRGRAYMYAFYTTLIVQVVMMWLAMSGIEIPVVPYIREFISVFAGLLVLCCYCIWKDVYWGLNNNRIRYIFVFGLFTVFNIFYLVWLVRDGYLMEDGKIGLPMLNIMVLFMMLVLAVEMLIKKLIGDKAGEDQL